MPSGRQLGIRRWRHAINQPPAWLTTFFIWHRCRAPSSALGINGCRSRFAATPLRGRSGHFRWGRRRDGFLRSATKTDPLCQRRTRFRIGRCGDWVISCQLPAGAILRGFKPVNDTDMPAEHLAEKPALEADDTVALHRSPDRDSRHQRCRCRRALAKATERAVHRRNQARELIDGDNILRDIAADNPRNQAEINRLHGAFIGHISFTRCFDWSLCGRERFFCDFSSTKYSQISRCDRGMKASLAQISQNADSATFWACPLRGRALGPVPLARHRYGRPSRRARPQLGSRPYVSGGHLGPATKLF
jgi:hypothetical protein